MGTHHHLMRPMPYKQSLYRSYLKHKSLSLCLNFVVTNSEISLCINISSLCNFCLCVLAGLRSTTVNIMAKILVLALVLIAVGAGGNRGIINMAGAQSPPSPIYSSSSCGASLASLVPCFGFLQGGANNTTPTQGCCTVLASAVDSSTVCVCQLFTTTNNPLGIPINNIPQAIPINRTRALTLPGACKITTPSLTQCMTTAVGAGAPVSTPVSSPPLPAISSPSPADAGIAKSPATSALPPATTGGVHSPSATHERSTGSANAGSMISMSMSMSSMVIVGIMNVIAGRMML